MNALSPELFQKYPPDVITKALLAHRDKLLRASREEVIAADREKCASLAGFIREGWHVIEPGTPYVHGWHLDCMSEHLEALADGQIRRLMITIPPGMAKSTCVSVFFPMWLWGPRGRPSARFVGVSHEQSLGVRDNLKCRRLVQSEWFQERWPMPIAKDQNEKLNFENLSTGFRQVATPSNVTGKRGDFVLCLPPDQRVKTPMGWITIGQIVEEEMNIRILGSGGWNTIERYERNPPGEIYELSFSNGCVLKCTGDHLISTVDAGWVRATDLRPGQGIQSADDEHLQELREGLPARGMAEQSVLQPAVLRSSPDSEAGSGQHQALSGMWCPRLSPTSPPSSRQARVLLLQMLQSLQLWRSKPSLSWRASGENLPSLQNRLFRQLGGVKAPDLLFRKLQGLIKLGRWKAQAIAAKALSAVFQSIQTKQSLETVLLGPMCELSALKAHEGQGEWAFRSWGKLQSLSAWLVAHFQGGNKSAGWQCVPRVQSATGGWPQPSARSSHRLQQRELGQVQPDHGLQVLPRNNARQRETAGKMAETTLVARKRIGFTDAPTYNLRVNPSHDYYAEGILVHNCDDLLSVENANSPVEREKVNLWMQEALPTRMNDPEKSAIVLIMQRVHEDDAVGMILAKKWGWDHLNLPMRYEAGNKSHTSIGWQDPRTKDGELLFPERFPEPVVKELERTLGSFATSSQLQQRPVPREGGLFKRAWFNMIKAAPVNARWVRYWDLAATAEQMSSEAAYTVGLKLGRTAEGRFVIADVARLRAEGQGVRRLIRETAREDGRNVEIGLPQDPGQAGKAQSQDMISMLAGYIVTATRESGDKLTRAEPVAAQAEAGNIDIVEADWTEAFMDELTTFPGSKFKDQVDALSGAFNKLIGDTVFDAREDYISVEPMPVMAIWPRVAAIHIDRKTVTTAWACHNPVTDVAFIYDTITVPRADMAIHANAIKKRGKWIPVMFNLKSKERDRDESVRLAQSLADLDVELLTVELDDEVAMSVIAERISVSSLRVFASQSDWFSAYRRLHRDDKDEIAGDDTGMMRTTGLIMASGLNVAVTENRAKSDVEGYNPAEQDRSAVTGY